ncbi:disease resistance RPP13-like protein 4 [Chenopodium quinoa]|uniref:disease resistance RPP13-like protein 4 n=1 Tax=Chenopodium quinoa TaxID=63459 RepID=UPI000B78E2CE|nr:disease resistance RPP13-like protein 4 [Chenopodium quinoa]
MNLLINSLIKHGNSLATLLEDAKHRSNSEVIHENVRKEVEELLEKLENPQLPPSFPETIIPKIIEKIQVTVRNFIKLDSDNATKFKDLAKKINEWKSKKQSSSETSLPEQPCESPTGDSTQHEASTIDDHQFGQLSDKQKKCLTCWGLFPAGMEIKKRELIFWWIALDLIDDPHKGDDILAEFVEKEFIERTIIGNKKLYNSYKMNDNVRSKVIQDISSFVEIDETKKHWSVMKLQPQPQPPKPKRRLTKSITFSKLIKYDDTNVPLAASLVINKEENSLGVKTFEWLNEKKNVKVLHLGSWDHNPKRYILVEDIEILKGLRNMGHLTCLSLQGISGIVELPESVYKLDNLKILDLRACPNLESLSEGIESLNQLTHLDLSECYLLDHIPRGIASLTKLRVLKGFVINPEDLNQVGVDGNEKKKKKNTPSMALFSDLSDLKELIKLTIRTRRMSFPTIQDFYTLFAMEKLTALRILWVRSSAAVPCATAATRFPKSLKKLQLQAAPKNTLPFLLWSISKDTESSLEKLYIRGGQRSDLDLDPKKHYFRNVHTVRLRYLPELTIHWDEFRKFFPKLTRLEILSCPNLIFFPCDENGVWVKTDTDTTMYDELH